ncbi:MAG: hypothetical protein D6732_18640 [Methanobacteriota archaeon]|nr:MAG: hypothetical protein D6732_18640 [Euryarchaeota archaeon]
MTIQIDIVIFGRTLFSGVELLERNVALVAMYFGLILKWVISNISNKDKDMPLLDIFFGKGFSALFKGDFGYITDPIKALFKLEGSLFSLLVVTLAAVAYPLIAVPIADLETFRAFIFKALLTGYSSDLLVAQARDIFKKAHGNRKAIQLILKEDKTNG